MWQLKSRWNWGLMGASSKNGVFISIAMFDSQEVTTWSCWGFKYGGFWEWGHHENHGFEHWTGPIFNLGYPHFWKAPNMYFCQGCDVEPYQDIPRWCCEEILAPHPWSPRALTVTMDHRCLPPGCDWDGRSFWHQKKQAAPVVTGMRLVSQGPFQWCQIPRHHSLLAALIKSQ